MFVFTHAALDLVSSEMEDAANILGAGTCAPVCAITLPLVLPAILGAFILAFLEAIALFGAPALIALPGALPRGDHAALAVLRVPAQDRGGRGLCDAAAR